MRRIQDMRRIQEYKNTVLQQRKPTNTGPVLIKNNNASITKLKKGSIIVIPPGAQDPILKKSAWLFQVLPPWQYPFNFACKEMEINTN